MKKKLTYRDKLIELAYIYDVKEIKDYEKSRKNLTSGQLELILKKNKIIIPKDFKSNFLRDNIVKPVSKIKTQIVEFKENRVKDKNKLIRKAENFKHDTNRKIARSFKDLWNYLGQIGLNFLNIIPKLGKVIYEFFGNAFTDLFHGIYTQQIEPKKAKRVLIGISGVVVVFTIVFSGINYFSGDGLNKKIEVKKEIKKPEVKKEVKKPEVKKEIKKSEVKKEVKKEMIPEPIIDEVIESEVKTDFPELASGQKAIGSISKISQPLDKYYLILASFFDSDLALDYAEKLILSESNLIIISPFSRNKFTRVALEYETLDKAKIGLDKYKDEFAEQLWVLKY